MSELTGRRVAAISLGAFGVIIAVNILLAVMATRTFSGLVVPNSYISGQTFDADRAAQRALGWRTEVAADKGYLRLEFTDTAGELIRPARLTVTVGRPGTNAEDAELAMIEAGSGYLGERPLAKGGWRAEIEAEAGDGTRFRQSRSLYVGEAR